MDFRRLTSSELSQFLQMHGRPTTGDLVQSASELFTQLQSTPNAQFSESVIDLYLAGIFRQSGQSIPQKYFVTVLQNLTPDQKQTFGQVLHLDVNTPNFTQRLIHILSLLDAVDSPQSLQTSAALPPKLWDWSVDPKQAPIPISYPVTKSYPGDRILQWRDWIGQNSGVSPDLVNFQVNDLRTLYRLYNEHFFNGALPTTVNFEISTRLTRVAGKCGDCPGKDCECRYRIKMSRPIFTKLNLIAGQKTSSGGVECRTRLECLQLVLEHEVMHLAIKHFIPSPIRKTNKQIYAAHGALFKDLIRSYYGQTRSTHDIGKIILSEEQGPPLVKGQAYIGQKASFYKKDTGIVKGIIYVVNPVKAHVKLLNGEGRIVRYDFLRQVPEGDEDEAELDALAQQIHDKLNYYRSLRVGDEVRYEYKDQIYEGTVNELKPRSNKFVATYPGGKIITSLYSNLVLPSSSGPARPVGSPSIQRRTPTPQPSSQPSGEVSQRLAQAIRDGLRRDDLVNFTNKGKTYYGMVLKVKPKYHHVHTLDGADWNVLPQNLSRDIPESMLNPLINLFYQIQRKRQVYSQLRPGAEVSFMFRGAPYTSKVSKIMPRSDTFIAPYQGTQEAQVGYTDIIV